LTCNYREFLGRIVGLKFAGGAAIAALVFAAGTTAALSSPIQTSSWRVVESKSASGKHPALTISAIISRPQGIGVRFTSPSRLAGAVYWDCIKGLQAEQGHFGALNGFHVVPHVRGEGSCQILVTAHGPRPITVTIFKNV
jgi:hypothetical protein